MRVIFNTIALYVSFLGGFILNFIQLKILSQNLLPVNLGMFFTIVAFGQIVSGVLVFGIPHVLLRYFPKFQSEKSINKIVSLFVLAIVFYILLVLITYSVISHYGYGLGFAIYKEEIIGEYLSFSFLVFAVVTLLSIIYIAFNGLRKMHFSAGLNLFYLSILTFLLFCFRKYLSIHIILKIYLFSGAVSVLFGCILLYFFYKSSGKGQLKWQAISIIKEISPYWKYAISLTILAPLSSHLDKLIIGHFLAMNFVASFTIASKINLWVNRVLDTPMQALTPEITYFWEKGDKAMLGQRLELVIKLLLLFSSFLASLIIIGGKEIILLVSTASYIDAFTPLVFFVLGTVISFIYFPITSVMKAIGKIRFLLISDSIWTLMYIIFTLALITKFQIKGVAIAYLIATLFALVFNVCWVAPRHTSLKIKPLFFIKLLSFIIIIGLLSYFMFYSLSFAPIVKFILLLIFLGACYFLFLVKTNILSGLERKQLKTIFPIIYN